MAQVGHAGFDGRTSMTGFRPTDLHPIQSGQCRHKRTRVQRGQHVQAGAQQRALLRFALGGSIASHESRHSQTKDALVAAPCWKRTDRVVTRRTVRGVGYVIDGLPPLAPGGAWRRLRSHTVPARDAQAA